MRPWLMIIAVSVSWPGCTHVALERRTVKQASTLTDLQYRQVLDNLAMFCCNPEALPWHVKLKSGTVQVTDQRGGALSGIFGVPGDPANSIAPSINAQRGILGQWDVEPETDADELELLTFAYKKAVRPVDQELDKEIRLAIWRLVATYDLACGSEVLLDIMKDAVDDELKTVTQTIYKGRTLQNAHDVDDAVVCLEQSFEQLKKLVDHERLGEEYQDGDERNMADAVRHLVDGDGNGDGPVTDTINLLQQAAQKTDGECQKKLIAAIRRLKLLKQKESQARLCDALLRLNPYREKVRRDQAGALQMLANLGRPVWDQYQQFLVIAGSDKYRFSQVKPKPERRNPGLIDQAEGKLETLKELLGEKDSDATWFSRGDKKDVDPCACYVGCYSNCGSTCYVWVMPDQMKQLKEFVLNVLTLAPIEDQDAFTGRGAAFSPGLR